MEDFSLICCCSLLYATGALSLTSAMLVGHILQAEPPGLQNGQKIQVNHKFLMRVGRSRQQEIPQCGDITVWITCIFIPLKLQFLLRLYLKLAISQCSNLENQNESEENYFFN